MTTMTVTHFARHLSQVFDRLEHGGENIVLVRRNHTVAKLVPGTATMKALDAFSDLYGIIPEDEGAAWIEDASNTDHLSDSRELNDPWKA